MKFHADGRAAGIEVLNDQRNSDGRQESIKEAKQVPLREIKQSRNGDRNCRRARTLALQRELRHIIGRHMIYLRDNGKLSVQNLDGAVDDERSRSASVSL